MYTPIWYGFYYHRSGNGVGPILTAPEPTRARQWVKMLSWDSLCGLRLGPGPYCNSLFSSSFFWALSSAPAASSGKSSWNLDLFIVSFPDSSTHCTINVSSDHSAPTWSGWVCHVTCHTHIKTFNTGHPHQVFCYKCHDWQKIWMVALFCFKNTLAIFLHLSDL